MIDEYVMAFQVNGTQNREREWFTENRHDRRKQIVGDSLRMNAKDMPRDYEEVSSVDIYKPKIISRREQNAHIRQRPLKIAKERVYGIRLDPAINDEDKSNRPVKIAMLRQEFTNNSHQNITEEPLIEVKPRAKRTTIKHRLLTLENDRIEAEPENYYTFMTKHKPKVKPTRVRFTPITQSTFLTDNYSISTSRKFKSNKKVDRIAKILNDIEVFSMPPEEDYLNNQPRDKMTSDLKRAKYRGVRFQQQPQSATPHDDHDEIFGGIMAKKQKLPDLDVEINELQQYVINVDDFDEDVVKPRKKQLELPREYRNSRQRIEMISEPIGPDNSYQERGPAPSRDLPEYAEYTEPIVNSREAVISYEDDSYSENNHRLHRNPALQLPRQLISKTKHDYSAEIEYDEIMETRRRPRPQSKLTQEVHELRTIIVDDYDEVK